MEVKLNAFLISATGGAGWLASRSGSFTSGEITLTEHWMRDATSCLDAVAEEGTPIIM